MATIGKRRFSSFVQQTLLRNTMVTVVVTVLNSFPLGWERAFSRAGVFQSLVYSFSIGTLISAAVKFAAPRLLDRSAVARLAIVAAIVFAATVVGVTTANLILSAADGSNKIQIFPPRSDTFVFSFLVAAVFGCGTFFAESAQIRQRRTEDRLRQRESDAARAANLAIEAQLTSLESRVHPHFLFNTLNSIAALIREDADLAEKTVERLAELLRYSLDANANRLVRLQQEIEITVDYLEIERARFGERLNYRIEIDERFENVSVPPFALQTLVENSVKHVAARRPGAIEIRVAARRANRFLEIEIVDDGAGFAARDIKNGHGLDVLQKRLAAVFGDAGHLRIDENAGGGRVVVRVPLTNEDENLRAAAPVARFSD